MHDPVREAYDAWAARYDADRNATRDLDARLLRDHLHLYRDRDVLEPGCGTGKNTRVLATVARTVTGLDLSPRMLDRARQRVESPRANLRQADLRDAWPVPAGAFDVVTVHLVVEHLEDLATFSARAARALRHGGLLVVSEFHPARQARGRGATPAGGDDPIPFFVHARADWLAALEGARFTLLDLSEHRAPGDDPEAPPRILRLVGRAAPAPPVDAA